MAHTVRDIVDYDRIETGAQAGALILRAITRRAAVIHLQHDIAPGCQKLVLGIETPYVAGHRAAVNVDDQRRKAMCRGRRICHVGVNHRSIPGREVEWHRVRHHFLFEPVTELQQRHQRRLQRTEYVVDARVSIAERKVNDGGAIG